MAFRKQIAAQQALKNSHEFPELPGSPRLTISQDQQAMGLHDQKMQEWYAAHRQTVQGMFDALAEEIRQLKQQQK